MPAATPPAETAAMPNVVGMSLAVAEQTITAAGFVVAGVTDAGTTVEQQTPAAGFMAQPGAT